MIAFGDDRSEAVAEFRDQHAFGEFIARLWRGVGVRLLIQMLRTLREGREVQIGHVRVRDDRAINGSRVSLYGALGAKY